MKDNSKPERRKQLMLYVNWPLIFSGLALVFALIMFTVSIKAGIISLIFGLTLTATALAVKFINKQAITNDMVNFAVHYGQVQKELIKEL
ncbi:MAG: hypothetical protein II740_02915, partial [Lachnospiraceae bacterium]|nr:hypothetical protein [Lachnospiraceae bacterium]